MVLKRTNNSSNTNKYHSMTGLTKLIRLETQLMLAPAQCRLKSWIIMLSSKV